MFNVTMAAAIDAARTLAQMDELSRAIWQAAGAEAVTAEEAQALAEALHVRRGAIREAIVPVGIPAGRVSLFPTRRRPVSPDRLASRDRRRRLAASGPMPPQLAARFTTGQLAVLRVVADEVRDRGLCALCIDAIAARAGVCRRLAQGAIRLAEGDGLLVIQERRHQGRKNDPNLIRIISREWQAWTRRGRRAGSSQDAASRVEGGASRTGCKAVHPTDRKALNPEKSGPTDPSQGCRKAAVDPIGRASPRIGAGDGTGGAMRRGQAAVR